MSNTKCCVPGCVNSSGSEDTLHKFPHPAKDKELFNTWLYSVGGPILSLENEHIFKYRRVCHIHFEERYWCQNNRLSKIAVPTKHLPGLTTTKFTLNESSVLRPIQNTMASEPSTSKGYPAFQPSKPVTLQHHPSPANKENIECIPDPATDNVPETNPVSENAENEKNNTRPVSAREALLMNTRKKLRKRVAVTPTEQALYRKLVQVGIKLSKCRNKIKRQTMKIKAMKNISSAPQFMKTLDNLPSTTKMLTLMQFRETRKKTKGRRFTLQEKILALSIFKQSPKGYRFLRKIFILPTPQTLAKLIHMANINPGINQNTMRQLKKSAEKMKKEHRLCIVLFDEMSLKPALNYNERKDRVSGFVTDGVDIRAEFADHAQVFMIRGLLKNYKQPVSYTFSQAATNGIELAKQLKIVIGEIQAAGFIVVATVCDQGTNNAKCYNTLLQETRGILLRKGQEHRENVVLINDQEIMPLYDPPHLIKCIRNNLVTKDLHYEKDGMQKIAKWFHLTCLLNENPGYRGIRLVPKLTDLHCIPNKIPRMKVKYATQVFSATVASNMGYLADKGILPAESKDTADILLFFDRLFDSVNGSYAKKKKHGKPLLAAATPSSPHRQLWRESKKILKEMKFTNHNTHKVEYVPVLKNWVWTLDGIEALLTKLQNKYDVTSVWLRHLNQDPIENFFGSIRSHGCRNVNPTAENFESAFATLLINSLSSVHAPGANCELDDCVALHETIVTGSSGSKERVANEFHIPEITITALEDKNDPRVIGSLQYVVGYFVKNAKDKVFKGCDQCKSDLLHEAEAEYIKYREYANKKWLHSPSDSILCCISNMQDITYEILKTNVEKPNLKELIKTMILMYIDFDFIKCNSHKDELISHLINVSSRFFVYSYCKEINKILARERKSDDDSDLLKTKAENYARKMLKRK